MAATAQPSATPAATRFDPAAALADVRRLASGIGTREATSVGFERAANLVANRLGGYGYRVQRQRFAVPAGISWGVRVPAGRTQNVVATPPGFDPHRPHRLIGAHLDTVPQAPGAEDNASGVSVLLELARMAAERLPEVPVVFVAFGAEEPRGPADDEHHYGSRRMVATMSGARRDALLGMVSLDRVGVRTSAVPLCAGGRGSPRVREELVAAARKAGVRVARCENRTSDHWPFEKAGLPAARIGGVPYAGYHSRRDVPAVVDAAQLSRVARISWAWLNTPE